MASPTARFLTTTSPGALGIIQPEDFDTHRVGMFLCGNDYGVGAALLDDACPSTTN